MTTLLLDVLLILLWLANYKDYDIKTTDLPRVSILVAARNEEHNISRCLLSLLDVDYPKNKLEILVGDDASEDKTLEVARKIADSTTHIKVYSVSEYLGNARGKANVLAHLAKEATGEVYCITDADIAVPELWIKGLLNRLTSDTAMVIGTTAIENDPFESIDWLFAMGMIKVITDLGQPVTAIGNNMCITSDAYHKVGGYESIPFSVTEDFELFKQVRKKGFNLVHIFNSNVLAQSKSVKGYKNLLHQRKRWMVGAMQLPWGVKTLLFFQAIFPPVLLGLFFVNIKSALSLFIIKVFLQSIFILLLHRRLKRPVNLLALLFYEFYAMLISISGFVFYLISTNIIWKGRKY